MIVGKTSSKDFTEVLTVSGVSCFLNEQPPELCATFVFLFCEFGLYWEAVLCRFIVTTEGGVLRLNRLVTVN